MKYQLSIFFLILMIFIIIFVSDDSFAQFPKTIDLSQTAADVTVYGAKDIDATGFRVASGDIDGNGFTDLIITTENAAPFGRDGAFEVEILWGDASFDSIIDLNDFQGDISRIFGELDDDGTFSSLCCGDFNNDGYDDVVIGVPYYDWYDGHAYIIFGRPDFPDTLDLAFTLTGITRIAGVHNEMTDFGWTCAPGDINGDSYDDLIVSAPNFDWTGDQVYIIYGRDVFPASIDMTTQPPNVTRIIDSDAYQATGKGLCCKDFDKDGYDDMFIGSPGNLMSHQDGKGILLYGAPDLPDTVLLSDPRFRRKNIYPEYSNGFLGYKLAIGDINSDNYEDLIISAYGASPLGCAGCGIVYLIYGSSTLPDSIYAGSTDISITRLVGAGHGERYGVNMTCADFLGDGDEDIALHSKPNLDNASDVNKMTILYGSPTLPDTVFLASDTSLTRILGEEHDDNFGLGIGIGDFDNDHIQDLLIGAKYASPLGRDKAGKVYLFYGTDTASAIAQDTPRFVLYGNFPNPFSVSTTIQYSVDAPVPVTFTIYNVLGQRISQMVNPTVISGVNSFEWKGLDRHGRPVASGLYLYKIEAAGVARFGKLALLR